MKTRIVFFVISVTLTSFLTHGYGQNLTKAELSLESQILDAKKEILIGKYDKALDILKPLYNKNRDNLTLSFEMAKAYVSIGDLESASKYIKNSLRIDPQNEWVNLFYGNLMIEEMRYVEAINSFELLSNQFPTRTDYYEMLIAALEKNNELTRAEQTIERLILNLGVNKFTMNRKYQFYEKHDQTDKAILALDQLIQKYPTDTRYLKLLALNYLSLGKEKEADQIYTEILEHDPNDTEANLALLKNIDDPKAQNNYLRALTPIIENDQVKLDAKIQELIPYTFQYQNNPSDTELESSLLFLGEKLTLTHPNEAKSSALYGDILYLAGQYKNAAKQYEKTLESNKNIFEVWLQYINTLNTLKEYKKLGIVAENCLEYFPNEPLPYAYLGLTQSHLGDYERAVSNIEEAGFIAGNNPVALSDIETIFGIYLIRTNDLTAAQTHLDKALQLLPSNTFTLKTLAEITVDPEKKENYYKLAYKYGDKSIQVLEHLNQ